LGGYLRRLSLHVDVKVSTLCKVIDHRTEFDPLLVLSLMYNLLESPLVTATSGFRAKGPVLQRLMTCHLSIGMLQQFEVEPILVPHMLEDELKIARINLRDNEHYMSHVAVELSASDSCHVNVSS
jgi:small RNA 2'-O-methyltransferase